MLSLHLITFLMFYILVHVTFLAADSYMLELKFAISITEQQAVLTGFLSRGHAVLAEESLTRLHTLTEFTKVFRVTISINLGVKISKFIIV